MKPVDTKDNTSIDFKKEVNDKDPKVKVGDHVRILNRKIFLLKYTHQTGLKKFLLLLKLKIVPWTYVINDLNGEEITGTFYGKELQKTNQNEFRIEKVTRRKGDKL